MKKVLIGFDDQEHEKALAKLDREKKAGKVSDAETFSSIVRGLLRQWIKK